MPRPTAAVPLHPQESRRALGRGPDYAGRAPARGRPTAPGSLIPARVRSTPCPPTRTWPASSGHWSLAPSRFLGSLRVRCREGPLGQLKALLPNRGLSREGTCVVLSGERVSSRDSLRRINTKLF